MRLSIAQSLTPYLPKILDEIHRQYYVAYDKRSRGEKHLKRKTSKRHEELPMTYDVRVSRFYGS